MLAKKDYIYKKFEAPEKNKYIVYGDNIQEATQIINWLAQFNNEEMVLQSIGYASLSEYIYIYKIRGEIYYFVAKAYYHNGTLPLAVRQVIKEMDKPDAVIYSVEEQKIIMGFETTSTTLAGNASWQRTGRIINFLEKRIPFAFLAYYTKLDQSDRNVNKKPRKPSALFVMMFIMLSLRYHAPALVGFFEHADKRQNIDPHNSKKDWRPAIFKYLFSLITTNPDCDHYLSICYENMKEYYFSKENILDTYNEYGSNTLQYVKDSNFSKNIIMDIKNRNDVPLFDTNLEFLWHPKKIEVKIRKMFPNINFFQLTKNCKTGICFQTEELVKIIGRNKNFYVEDHFSDYLSNIKNPSVIIPIKLTKKAYGKLVPTDDPYNGEISAFSEMYRQSFPQCNIIILLEDHTSNNEYEVEKAKTRKVYKAINKYADLVIDMDLNIFSKESEYSKIENRNKYESIRTTEDDITSFFETVLLNENITPSFINPPCGSWSDLFLLPINKYYYYKRNDIRADIAYFNPADNTYYVGESKNKFPTSKAKLTRESEKIKKVVDIIERELEYQYPTKTFAIFKGNIIQARAILKNSDFDYVVVVDDTDNITLKVVGR